jgi:O-antigen ligase
MMERLRALALGYPAVISLGMVVGAMAAIESWLSLVLFLGVAFTYASFKKPAIPVAVAFLGILLDAGGMTSLRLFGLPVTLSKGAVLFALGSHFVHCMVLRKPMFTWTPVTPGIAAILMTMILSLITSIDARWGYIDIMGVAMLGLMMHLVYQSVDEVSLPWMVRIMTAFTIGVLLWTLATQRKEGFFVTLDHAWQQRTSGAFGDPNAWSTALLVICPILLAALAADRHWSSTPLLILLGAAFPACIFQSMSRAGLLSFVVIFPGLVYVLRKRTRLLAFSFFVFLMAVPLVLNIDAALLRYRTLLDPTLEADLGHGSLRERTALLKAGIKIFMENPLLGVGTGLFRLHASYVSAGEVWKIAHNSYINVAAEQGIPGILSHLYFGSLLYKSAWQAAIRAKTEYTRSFGQGYLLALLAFSAMAMTLNLATFAAAWYMLGLGLLVGKLGEAERVPDRLERVLAANEAEAAREAKAA